MKYGHFLLLLSVLTLITLNSCEKCTTCTYSQTSFGVTTTYDESYCGEKDELETFENDFRDDAQQQGVNAQCVRE